jgi:hypothetical protein
MGHAVHVAQQDGPCPSVHCCPCVHPCCCANPSLHIALLDGERSAANPTTCLAAQAYLVDFPTHPTCLLTQTLVKRSWSTTCPMGLSLRLLESLNPMVWCLHLAPSNPPGCTNPSQQEPGQTLVKHDPFLTLSPAEASHPACSTARSGSQDWLCSGTRRAHTPRSRSCSDPMASCQIQRWS